MQFSDHYLNRSLYMSFIESCLNYRYSGPVLILIKMRNCPACIYVDEWIHTLISKESKSGWFPLIEIWREEEIFKFLNENIKITAFPTWILFLPDGYSILRSSNKVRVLTWLHGFFHHH